MGDGAGLGTRHRNSPVLNTHTIPQHYRPIRRTGPSGYPVWRSEPERAPSGRLTQTFYPNEYTAQIEMADMHMRPDAVTGRPGRTYRFYTG